MPALVRVRRAGLPRYEVEYTSVTLALDDAKNIKKTQVLKLPVAIAEPLGAELVCDLMTTEVPIGTTLLFRIVHQSGPEVVLEWWPRRQTDPDLLDLWIECLAARAEVSESAALSHSVAEQQRELLDLCRTTIAHNPFVVLGLHWSAPGEEVEDAATALERSLSEYRKRPGLTTRGAELTDAALARVAESRAQLTTLAGRQAARIRFVPREDLRRAREHAARRVELCLMAGNKLEAQRAAATLKELGPRV